MLFNRVGICAFEFGDCLENLNIDVVSGLVLDKESTIRDAYGRGSYRLSLGHIGEIRTSGRLNDLLLRIRIPIRELRTRLVVTEIWNIQHGSLLQGSHL